MVCPKSKRYPTLYVPFSFLLKMTLFLVIVANSKMLSDTLSVLLNLRLENDILPRNICKVISNKFKDVIGNSMCPLSLLLETTFLLLICKVLVANSKGQMNIYTFFLYVLTLE